MRDVAKYDLRDKLDVQDAHKRGLFVSRRTPCSAAEEPRQASWNEIQRAMIEEQQAAYDEYVRRCGGVPISNVPPPNAGSHRQEEG